MRPSDIDHRFTYHPSNTPDAITRHETVRGGARAFAELVTQHTPEGREQSLAITAIEEALMWANAGIARGGRPHSGPCRCNPRLRTKGRGLEEASDG